MSGRLTQAALTALPLLSILGFAGLVVTVAVGFEEPDHTLLALSAVALVAPAVGVFVHVAFTRELNAEERRVWLAELTGPRATWAWSNYLSCRDRRQGARKLAEHRRSSVSQKSGLMILVAGPYRSGAGDDPDKMAANVRAMEAYTLPLFRAGHLPVVGEWLALPMVALAGSRHVGDQAFDEIFHPMAERLVERCDAVLRVGGASQGADEMVRLARGRGLAVFHRLSDVPGCETAPEPAPSTSRRAE